MFCAKYGFSQSMDCPVQTIDPYFQFVRAIHGLHSPSINVYSYISISFFLILARVLLA